MSAFIIPCTKCKKQNVLDRKPAEKIEIICHECGEKFVADPAAGQAAPEKK